MKRRQSRQALYINYHDESVEAQRIALEAVDAKTTRIATKNLKKKLCKPTPLTLTLT